MIPRDYFPQEIGHSVSAGGGEFFLIEHSASILVPGIEDLPARFAETTKSSEIHADQVLFLDLETTSLTSTQPLFLVGLIQLRGTELIVSQLFARDYTEEPALLAYLPSLAESCQLIVTYNGKRFDLPYLRDRMMFHRQRFTLYQEHLDLLLKAKVQYRGCYRDCKLQTLEEHLCNRRRLDDSPGHLIPELYHQFVLNGDWGPLRGVFYHNALDLLTMVELMPHLAPSLS
jgi:uncharacterized protein YprB with RNaseH-like and TPR domain